MRIRIDPDRCQGHTLCSVVAPEVFLLRDDDGHAYTELDHVPPELLDRVVKGAAMCPERAITLLEE